METLTLKKSENPTRSLFEGKGQCDSCGGRGAVTIRSPFRRRAIQLVPCQICGGSGHEHLRQNKKEVAK